MRSLGLISLATLIAALLLASGCSTPAGPALPRAKTHDVERWDLEGPFPTPVQLESHRPQDDWERVFEEAAREADSKVVISRAMHCAAVEYARFFLSHQALPAAPLQVFIQTRCGVIASAVVPRFFYAEVPDAVADEELLAQWRPSVAEIGQWSAGAGGPRSAALAYRRAEGRAVAIGLAGDLRVVLEPWGSAPGEQGTAVVRGRLLVPAERVFGLVNQGTYGFARCERREGRMLPEFEIACPIDPGDEFALLEVLVLAPGRFLGQQVLQLQARRTPGASFSPHRYVPAQPVSDPAGVAAQLLAVLNQVRADAGMRALTLDPGQTELVTASAPDFFDAIAAGDGRRQDELALELVAGREVSGLVRRGNFVVGSVAPSLDVGLWTTSVLHDPGGRSVLLDPEIHTIALGPEVLPDRMDVLATGYVLFDESTVDADGQRVLGRLAELRAERNRSAPWVFEDLVPKTRELANLVKANQRRPQRAMRELAEEGSLRLNRPVQAASYEVSDLDQLPFQDELLDRDSLGVAIGVAHRQSADFPWARYLILMLVADPPVGAAPPAR